MDDFFRTLKILRGGLSELFFSKFIFFEDGGASLKFFKKFYWAIICLFFSKNKNLFFLGRKILPREIFRTQDFFRNRGAQLYFRMMKIIFLIAVPIFIKIIFLGTEGWSRFFWELKILPKFIFFEDSWGPFFGNRKFFQGRFSDIKNYWWGGFFWVVGSDLFFSDIKNSSKFIFFSETDF